MKKFNKDKALNKLDNKNNSNIKRNTIIISICILIGAIIYFSFARFESNSTFSLINGTVVSSKKNIAEKMISLATKGASDLEYDGVDTHGVNGTVDNNLRYVGSTPNNYIYFNCSTTNPDEMNDTTCEKWRIIGLMNNIEDENGNKATRVKIMRDRSLGHYSWDSSPSSVNELNGINQWGESLDSNGTTYEGADLMRELNTDYLGNITVGTDGKWYDSWGNSKKSNMPTSVLNSNAQNMIETVKWNLGSISNNNGTFDSTWYNNITPLTSYERERADTNGKTCTNGTSCNDNITRTSTWIGKVALMYPSDYGYSTSGGSISSKADCLNISMYSNLIDDAIPEEKEDCDNNSWINSWNINGEIDYDIYNEMYSQWTLSPFAYSDSAISVFINESGNIQGSGAYAYVAVRPTLYLKNNINIVSGNGTESNPYKLVQLPYELLSGDLNTVGSVVKIADEEFYVIGQEDENHVKLLSKWNLNVGSNAKGSPTNLQDSDVRGWVSSGTKYGNVVYSSGFAYWYDSSNSTLLKSEYGDSYPAWVYTNAKENNNYIASIAEYVDNYVIYLTQQGVNVTGRLISHEEIASLGCSVGNSYCDTTHGGTAPAWVYQTSYWTGSADSSSTMRLIYSDGYYGNYDNNDGGRFGVRPVIVLEK